MGIQCLHQHLAQRGSSSVLASNFPFLLLANLCPSSIRSGQECDRSGRQSPLGRLVQLQLPSPWPHLCHPRLQASVPASHPPDVVSLDPYSLCGSWCTLRHGAWKWEKPALWSQYDNGIMELGNESERLTAPSWPSPAGALTQRVSVNRPLPRPAAPGLFLWCHGEAWRSPGKGAFQETGSLGSRLRELSCSLSEAPK